MKIALSLVPLLAILVGSCAMPPAGSLEWEDVTASLASRDANGGAEAAFAAALQQDGLGPTALRLPGEGERELPRQRGYWMVRALAWSPEVRAARGEAAAVAAEASSAGAPAPVFLQAVDHEIGGDDELVEAIGAVDLVGLLGLGPSRAESELAYAKAALALARLEEAAFHACLDVERARVLTVAARCRVERLDELYEAAQLDLERVRILRSRDRLSQAAAELAFAEVARVERARSVARVAWLDARRELALAAGVRGDVASGDLLSVGATGLAEMIQGGVVEAALDEEHPRLRVARAGFLVAESGVREAASRAWPGIGLGPHLGVLSGARVGAVLRLALPFPSSWKGRLGAAVERRDRTVELYEETVLELEQRAAEAQARLAELSHRADRDSGATVRAMAPAKSHWTASRALFRSGRGPLSGWTKALNHLTETVTWEIDDAEAAALAELDAAKALGLTRLLGPADIEETTTMETQP